MRLLMGHLIGTARRGLGTAQRVSTREVPHVVTDVADGDQATTYAGLTVQIRTAWSRLNEADWVTAPWGRCTAPDAVLGFTIETLVHGWDLAVATGQPSTILDDAAQRCLPCVTDVIPDRLRGVMYDQPVNTSTATSAAERLAHLLGRQTPSATADSGSFTGRRDVAARMGTAALLNPNQ